MKKPTRRVTKWLGDIPVEASCTQCPAVSFQVQGSSHRPNCEEYQKSFEAQFDAYCKAVEKSLFSVVTSTEAIFSRSSHTSLPEWHRKNVSGPLFYAAISDVLATGKRATTTVPVPLELIFKLPPSCRSLSRIPLIPTPGVPPDSRASRFPGGMPLPLSSTSRLSWPSERLMRILATGLSE